MKKKWFNQFIYRLVFGITFFFSIALPTFTIADTLTDGQLWQQVFDKVDAGDTNLKDHTRRARHFLSEKFGITEAGGYREDDDGQGTGHGAGLAVDFMIDAYGGKGDPQGKGRKLADFAVKNFEALQISYIIFEQKFYMGVDNIYGPANTWNPMPDRGSNTQNHFDHVHISFRIGGGNQSKEAVFEGISEIAGVSDAEYVVEPSTVPIHDELPSEEELIGMTKKGNLSDSQSDITFADGSSLSVGERYNMTSVRESVKNNSFSFINLLRVLVTVVGIIVAVYGLLLLVVYVFDRSNTFLDISLLRVLSFGNLAVDFSGEGGLDGKARTLNTGGILKVFMVTQLVGWVLYSGVVYAFLSWLYYFILGLFGG